MDFAEFKAGTVSRRVHRRVLLQRRCDLTEYARLVEQNPSESSSLFEDLLIGITGFLRDPEVFETLEATVIPSLLSHLPSQDPVRVWVPGCATGEEVYSIRSDRLLQTSTVGAPLPGAPGAVLQAGGRRVAGTQGLREMCVFARHNLGVDAPFSRMDLVSCRNVLIYLAETLQQRRLTAFHYALRGVGFLMLGRSETLGDAADLFAPVDQRTRLYQKRLGAAVVLPPVAAGRTPLPVSAAALDQPSSRSLVSRGRLAERIVATEYGPAWVLVDENHALIESKGNTSPFIRMRMQGRTSLLQ